MSDDDDWEYYDDATTLTDLWQHLKGQLISKYIFAVFKFFQKPNENKLTCGIIVSS